MTNRTNILLAAAALAIGCGSGAARTNEPARTSARAEARPTAGTERGAGRALDDPWSPTATATAEVDPFAALDAQPVARRLENVNVYLTAQSPVGLIPDDRAEAFPVHVNIENDGQEPLRLDQVLARIVVTQNGETVCEDPELGSIRLLDEGEVVIEPGSGHRLTTSLPCGLPVGDYDLIAEVFFSDDEAIGVPAPSDPHLAASMTLDVSDFETPYGRERPTLAEVPARDPAWAQALPPTDREL